MREGERAGEPKGLAGSKRKFDASEAAAGQPQAAGEAGRRLLGVAFFTSAIMGMLPLQQLLQTLPSSQEETVDIGRPSKRQAMGAAADQAGGAEAAGGSGAGAQRQQEHLPPSADSQDGAAAVAQAAFASGGQQQQQQAAEGAGQGQVDCDPMDVEGGPEALAIPRTQEAAAHADQPVATGTASEGPPQPHLPPALLGPLSAQRPLSRAQLRQQLQQKRGGEAAAGGAAGSPARLPPAEGLAGSVHPRPVKSTRGNRLLGLVKHGQAPPQHAQQPSLPAPAAAELALAAAAAPQTIPTPSPPELGSLEPLPAPAAADTSGPTGAQEGSASEDGSAGAGSELAKQARQPSAQQRRLTQSPYRLSGRSGAAGQLEEGEGLAAEAGAAGRPPAQKRQQQPAVVAAGGQAGGSLPTSAPAELPSPPMPAAGGLQPGSRQSTPAKAPPSSAGAGALAQGEDTPGPSPLLGGARGCTAAALRRVGQLVADLEGDEEVPHMSAAVAAAGATPPPVQAPAVVAGPEAPALAAKDPAPGPADAEQVAALPDQAPLDEEAQPMLEPAAAVEATAPAPVPLLASTGPYMSKRRRSLLSAMSAGGAVGVAVGAPGRQQPRRRSGEGSHAGGGEPGSSSQNPGASQQQQEEAQQPAQLPSLSPSPANLSALSPAAAAATPQPDAMVQPSTSPHNPFPGFWTSVGGSHGAAVGVGAAVSTPAGQLGTGAGLPAAAEPPSQDTPELMGFQPRQPAPPPSLQLQPAQEAGRKERKVRFAVPCGDDGGQADREDSGPAAAAAAAAAATSFQAPAGPGSAAKPVPVGRPGTPAKPPLPKMRVPAPPAFSRFGSTAFRKYNGPAGRRAALLSFVSDSGASCVALAPAAPPPASPLGSANPGLDPLWDPTDLAGEAGEGAGEAAGGEVAGAGAGGAPAATAGGAVGDGGAVNIPRRLNHPHALARRLSMAEPPSPKDSALQDLREAFLNARLAGSWAAGEPWARLDLAGVELEAGQAPEYQQRLDKLCAVLGEAQGQEGAERVVAQLEGEWRHLQRLRQRYAAGAAGGAAAEPEQPGTLDGVLETAADSPRRSSRSAPRGILKQPSPLGHAPRTALCRPGSASPPHPALRLPQQAQKPAETAVEASVPVPAAGQLAAAEDEAAPTELCSASPIEQQQQLAAEDTVGAAAAEPAGPPLLATAASSAEGSTPQAAAQVAGEALGEGETTPGEGEGPLELTPDAAVELTPGPGPSRGLKMLQSAGLVGTGAGAGGATPSRIALAFPPAQGAASSSLKDAAGGTVGITAAVAARGTNTGGPQGGGATGIGGTGARRQQKLSRGARLLQALQAGSHRGGSSSLPASCAAVPAEAGGMLASGGSSQLEMEGVAGRAAAGGGAGDADADIWAEVLASPL